MLIGNIAFLDIEVGINSGKIDKLGLLIGDIEKHATSIGDIRVLLEQKQPNFICGHNFIDHDEKYLSQTSLNSVINKILLPMTDGQAL